MTAAARDLFADGWLSSPPQYRTDLDRCEPAAALSATAKRGHWRTMSFETEDVAGTMIVAGPETAAPAVSFPLRASGWHAVSVGIVPNFKCTDDTATVAVPVKLSSDDTYSLLTLDLSSKQTRLLPDWHGGGVAEMFWKIADLTDQSLDIRQLVRRVAPGDAPGSFSGPAARVAYVKLTPLTDDELEIWQADQARTDTRRLFAHNDSHGPHYLFRLTTEEEVRREIEPYRDTDVSRIYWEAGGGDRTRFFSRIARAEIMEGQEDFGRRGDRMHAESWRDFQRQGVDPFDVALAHTHALGMEFHACYRVAGFKYPPPLDGASLGEVFFDRHPECRGEDRAGNRTPRMAYSYSAVREFVISLLREIAERPVDGVCLLFNRRMPLVEYEPPVVEGFKEEYGLDARELAAGDARWLAYRARTLTGFMREVRAAMDEVGEARGTRIDVGAVVAATEQENLQDGIDLRAWLDEGLIDTLIPYSSEPVYDSHHPSWTDPSQLAFFVDLVRGTDCVLAPNLMPRHQSPEDFRRRASTVYEAGAGHMFFWDAAGGCGRANYQPMWSGLKRLGHQDEIAAWQAAGEPDLPRTIKPLRKWDGWDFAYETPG